MAQASADININTEEFVKSQESRVKSQESRVKSQESRVKSQESRVIPPRPQSLVPSPQSPVPSPQSLVPSPQSAMYNCLINWLAVTNSSDLISLLQFPFMQRAIAGAVLMGILGGMLGSFVTLRQLSFFSHAVGHAALVGVALGVLLQINPTWMLLPFTLIFGVIVLYFIDKTDLASDSVLSIVLSGALAIGVILTSLIQGYRGNLMGVLFGDILAIGVTDLMLTLLVLVGGSIFLLSSLRQQILLTLNVDVAQVQGIPVQLYRYGFVVLLSLAVAVAIKAVGVLLVNAFLVIPASTAKLMSQNFTRFLVMSVIIGSTSSVVGMMVSGIFNLASGPSIVLVQFLVFVAVFIGVKVA